MNSDYLLDVYKRVTQAHHEQMGYPPLKATLGEREPQAGPQPPRRPHRAPSRSPSAARILTLTAITVVLILTVAVWTALLHAAGWAPHPGKIETEYLERLYPKLPRKKRRAVRRIFLYGLLHPDAMHESIWGNPHPHDQDAA